MRRPVSPNAVLHAPSRAASAGVWVAKAPLKAVPIPVRGAYGAPPPVPLSLVRAALTPRPWGARRAVPRLEARLEGFQVDSRTLERYRSVMHTDTEVPLAFPQLVATQLHLALLGSPRFPLSVAGLVHPRFTIHQRHALAPDDPLDVHAWIEGRRETRSGIEFDLRATVATGGEILWESTAATLSRRKRKKPSPSAASRTEPQKGSRADSAQSAESAQSAQLAKSAESGNGAGSPGEPDYPAGAAFEAPADAGRRYAAVSGDYNPIHLHPRTSVLMGYKRPIAHGWWLLGRCLAELGLDGAQRPTVVEVEFLRPTMLPATLELVSLPEGSETGTTTRFALRDEAGKPKLTGVSRPA